MGHDDECMDSKEGIILEDKEEDKRNEQEIGMTSSTVTNECQEHTGNDA